jgi:hypothetical protein
LDRLDDAFLFAQTIDQETYERQRNRLLEDLALARVDQHASAVDEMDVEAVLAFAEEVLPTARQFGHTLPWTSDNVCKKCFFPKASAREVMGLIEPP